jgi:rubrerythrin
MRNFKKVTENFICEKCGHNVVGDGYTDHCPKCLWGKHMDEEVPGDRASNCRGLMEPIESKVYQVIKYKVKYRCVKCGHEFWVREGVGDDRNLLRELSVCI